MASDAYFEGNQFEEKIAQIFEENNFSTDLKRLRVNPKKQYLQFTAKNNKIIGDGSTSTANFTFYWDAKLHEFVTLSSIYGFKGNFYIISEKGIGGSKEEIDLNRIWIIPREPVLKTAEKIINTVGQKGFDAGPVSGDPGIFLNLVGENPGPVTQLAEWATKMSLKDFLEIKCEAIDENGNLDMSLVRSKAIQDEKEYDRNNCSQHISKAILDEKEYNSKRNYNQFFDL